MTRKELAKAMRSTFPPISGNETLKYYGVIAEESLVMYALGTAPLSFRESYEAAGFERAIGRKATTKEVHIPDRLAKEISDRYWKGQSITEIISWLESSEEQEADHV
jgi:hypothetical protein